MSPAREPSPEELTRIVERVLRRLRVSGRLVGTRYLTCAISEAVTDPYSMLAVTKKLYPKIGAQYQTSPKAVEHALRTTIRSSWTGGGQQALEEMLGYCVGRRPSNAEFIDLVASYIRLNLLW